MKLERLGWSDFFEAQFAPLKGSGLVPARVTAEAGPVYMVETGEGPATAQVSGRFQYIACGRADFPATGDWVLARGEGDLLMIERVLDRKSRFSRTAAGGGSDEQVLAANVDTMFVTASLEGGRNFTERGLERYLVMVADGGAAPVIVLNKCDLCPADERDDFSRRVASIAGNVPLVMLSALTGEGLDALRAHLVPGETAAFTGPSGVGKSALINALLGREVQHTGRVREDDRRGRHTTTRRELFFLENGAMMIDTPGLRELRPSGDAASLELAFPEIAEAAAHCKFRDCGHADEPGCAVLRQVSEGTIAHDRYQAYMSLASEMRAVEALRTEKGRRERKARDREIAKLVKEYNRKHRE